MTADSSRTTSGPPEMTSKLSEISNLKSEIAAAATGASAAAAAAATDVPLPKPLRERWQPLRSGVLNLFRYDYEEFHYEEGRLLLRGNNGSGKSRILALQLPFLLDGEVSPARVEPDGDAAKRIEWNLLMGRYPRPHRLHVDRVWPARRRRHRTLFHARLRTPCRVRPHRPPLALVLHHHTTHRPRSLSAKRAAHPARSRTPHRDRRQRWPRLPKSRRLSPRRR